LGAAGWLGTSGERAASAAGRLGGGGEAQRTVRRGRWRGGATVGWWLRRPRALGNFFFFYSKIFNKFFYPSFFLFWMQSFFSYNILIYFVKLFSSIFSISPIFLNFIYLS
jgi:hypothetical protein